MSKAVLFVVLLYGYLNVFVPLPDGLTPPPPRPRYKAPPAAKLSIPEQQVKDRGLPQFEVITDWQQAAIVDELDKGLAAGRYQEFKPEDAEQYFAAAEKLEKGLGHKDLVERVHKSIMQQCWRYDYSHDGNAYDVSFFQISTEDAERFEAVIESAKPACYEPNKWHRTKFPATIQQPDDNFSIARPLWEGEAREWRAKDGWWELRRVLPVESNK